MPRCRVIGCGSDTHGNKPGSKLSFHVFPHRDRSPRRLKQWVNYCRRKTLFQPTADHRICSKHFRESDFDPSQLLKSKLMPNEKIVVRLLPGAVPSVPTEEWKASRSKDSARSARYEKKERKELVTQLLLDTPSSSSDKKFEGSGFIEPEIIFETPGELHDLSFSSDLNDPLLDVPDPGNKDIPEEDPLGLGSPKNKAPVELPARDSLVQKKCSPAKKNKIINAHDCKVKWKNIRDYYQRRKRENKLPTGPVGASSRKDASVIGRLSFLQDALDKTPADSDSTVQAEDSAGGSSQSAHDGLFIKEELIDTCSEDAPLVPEAESSTFAQTTDAFASINSETFGSRPAPSAPPKPKLVKKIPFKRTLPKKRPLSRDRLAAEFHRQSKDRQYLMENIIQSALLAREISSQETCDPIDQYLKGISASIKTLPPLLQLEAKRDISRIVNNLEFRALQEQNHFPSPSASSSSRVGFSPYDSNVSFASPQSPKSPPFPPPRTVYSPDEANVSD